MYWAHHKKKWAHAARLQVLAVHVWQVAAEMDTDSDVVLLLAAFRSLAASQDAHCHSLCASALPAILRAATARRHAKYHGLTSLVICLPHTEQQPALPPWLFHYPAFL
jgi:hypothetical protein